VRRTILIVIAVLVGGFVLIQLVPYGRDHTNPPVTGSPQWDSARTEQLARAACFDCHSNETAWPWYSNVAPVSWLLQRHVDEGRARLNFSEWGSGRQETEHMVGLVREGEMPPWDFKLLHPEARLSDAEQQELITGLTNTFGAGEGSGGGEADD
jgi:mono/diheme cytochrome c family protein